MTTSLAPKRWQAIVFDVDDTLVATRETGLEKLVLAADSLAITRPDSTLFMAFYGTMSYQMCIEKLFAAADVERVAVAYDKVNVPHRPLVALGQWIPLLRSEGYQVGILTNGLARKTKAKLAATGARESDLDVIVSLGDSPLQKPAKGSFDQCIEALELDPAFVVYVGDSVLDAYAALNAGMCFVAVLTGVGTREDFTVAGVQTSDIYDDVNCFLTSLVRTAR